jgi:hypothetical protein
VLYAYTHGHKTAHNKNDNTYRTAVALIMKTKAKCPEDAGQYKLRFLGKITFVNPHERGETAL